MGRPIYRSVLIEPGVRLQHTHRGIETEATVWIDSSPLWKDGMRPHQTISEAQSKADRAAEGFAVNPAFPISEVVKGKRGFMDGVENWFDRFIGSTPGIMLYDLPNLSSLPTFSMPLNRPQPSSARPPQTRDDVVLGDTPSITF